MKKTYGFGNSSEMLDLIKKQAMLEIKMDSIEIDFATYNVNIDLSTLLRIFLYPNIKEFDPGQIIKLKKAIENTFIFRDRAFPKGIADYNKNKYIWMRDFREEEGSFIVKRRLEKYIIGNDLIFFIENAPKLNCRLEKKKVTREVYEAICD